MGKRKARVLTKNDGHTDDNDSPTSEFCKDLVAPMTKKDMLVLKKRIEQTSVCLSGIIPQRTRSKCRGSYLSGKLSKMDDGTFNMHLENIWRSLSEDKRAAFAHLDSLYFRMYQYPNKRNQALELIKRKDIFSKNYVLVPIVCWDHWRLVVFCHFGQTARSKTKTRCILLLDSAEMCANLIGPDLRKFVFDIFKAEGRPESKNVIFRIPLLVPKVPQQSNDIDCGRFVLYFIKLFMDKAPENFSRSNGYPYFMTSEWFPPECFAKFCAKLEEEIPTVNQGEEQVPRRCSQRIKNARNFGPKTYQKDKDIILIDE